MNKLDSIITGSLGDKYVRAMGINVKQPNKSLYHYNGAVGQHMTSLSYENGALKSTINNIIVASKEDAIYDAVKNPATKIRDKIIEVISKLIEMIKKFFKKIHNDLFNVRKKLGKALNKLRTLKKKILALGPEHSGIIVVVPSTDVIAKMKIMDNPRKAGNKYFASGIDFVLENGVEEKNKIKKGLYGSGHVSQETLSLLQKMALQADSQMESIKDRGGSYMDDTIRLARVIEGLGILREAVQYGVNVKIKSVPEHLDKLIDAAEKCTMLMTMADAVMADTNNFYDVLQKWSDLRHEVWEDEDDKFGMERDKKALDAISKILQVRVKKIQTLQKSTDFILSAVNFLVIYTAENITKVLPKEENATKSTSKDNSNNNPGGYKLIEA